MLKKYFDNANKVILVTVLKILRISRILIFRINKFFSNLFKIFYPIRLYYKSQL